MGIRTAIAEVRFVPSGSMEPTIEIGDRLLTIKALYHFKEPARGDIVIFDVPEEAMIGKDKTPFVKRVIGLPGDVVEIRSGVVYINGKEYKVPSAKIPEYDYGPVKIEQGNLFVLGDNRNHSYDSHEWGQLPEDNVIAKAVFVIWPLTHVKVLK
ncbi:MAG: signal peptidase I [Rubrobacteridae bacterium]|nr:signal peptidase I [Rubrobacteridae bacterium]